MLGPPWSLSLLLISVYTVHECIQPPCMTGEVLLSLTMVYSSNRFYACWYLFFSRSQVEAVVGYHVLPYEPHMCVAHARFHFNDS